MQQKKRRSLNLTQSPEATKAVAWRQRHGMTPEQLAELTGYSMQTIYWMERGWAAPKTGEDPQPIKPWVWKRYKMACLGAAAQLHARQEWDWS